MKAPFVWTPDGKASTEDGYRAEISLGAVSGKMFVKVEPPRGMPAVDRCQSRAEGQKWADKTLAEFRAGKL